MRHGIGTTGSERSICELGSLPRSNLPLRNDYSFPMTGNPRTKSVGPPPFCFRPANLPLTPFDTGAHHLEFRLFASTYCIRI